MRVQSSAEFAGRRAGVGCSVVAMRRTSGFAGSDEAAKIASANPAQLTVGAPA